jgi:hypothetical protein
MHGESRPAGVLGIFLGCVYVWICRTDQCQASLLEHVVERYVLCAVEEQS